MSFSAICARLHFPCWTLILREGYFDGNNAADSQLDADARSVNHAAAAMAETSFYRRSNFVTHLPAECLYSPSHFWLRRMSETRWRVGFTKFATRMLGEIVEVRFEKEPGAAVSSGDIVGSIEGFKAISDIYCCANGTFAGANPALQSGIEKVGEAPYADGWLYEFDGEPDSKCIPLAEYRSLLDTTIDRILEKQQSEEP